MTVVSTAIPAATPTQKIRRYPSAAPVSWILARTRRATAGDPAGPWTTGAQTGTARGGRGPARRRPAGAGTGRMSRGVRARYRSRGRADAHGDAGARGPLRRV